MPEVDVSQVDIAHFVELLASKEPTPGGGGASAVVGATGAALGNMLASLTLGKKRYANVEDRVRDISANLQRISEELLQQVSKDAQAFTPLSQAYKLPHATQEELAYKTKTMEAALVHACEPPLHIMRLCCEAVVYVEEISLIGSRLALSDAGAGASLLSSALKAASLNIFINTALMKNRDQADQLAHEATVLMEQGCRRADAVFKCVREELMCQS